MRNFNDEDPLGWITAFCIGMIALMLTIFLICLVAKGEQRKTPKDTQSAMWADYNRVKYNL